MTSNRDKSKGQQKALRAVAESEEMDGSDTDDDGLDIIKTSRKDLDISQYIDGQWISAYINQDTDDFQSWRKLKLRCRA